MIFDCESRDLCMEKYCWQIHYLETPTPCFIRAGTKPCESMGCTITNRLEELAERGIEQTLGWISLLSHSACRISSLSPDNSEYLTRTQRSN